MAPELTSAPVTKAEAELTALATARDVTVAPVMASKFSPTARSPRLYTSWDRNSASERASMPRPKVSSISRTTAPTTVP